jgi:hypothetical protein
MICVASSPTILDSINEKLSRSWGPTYWEWSAKRDFDIDGSNGWNINNDVMANGYYNELVRGNPNDSVQDLVNNAPAWRRILEMACDSRSASARNAHHYAQYRHCACPQPRRLQFLQEHWSLGRAVAPLVPSKTVRPLPRYLSVPMSRALCKLRRNSKMTISAGCGPFAASWTAC